MDFNPRTPCGVRRGQDLHLRCERLFQSTHPLRGATVLAVAFFLFRPISIHAPLAGCDFDPERSIHRENISIHAPLAGCDSWEDIMERMGYISIHAPLAGCDIIPIISFIP